MEESRIENILDSFTVDIVDSIKGKPKVKKIKDKVDIVVPEKPVESVKLYKAFTIYKEWLEPKLEYIKEELEGYFPGNWDLQIDDTKVKNFEDVVRKLDDSVVDINQILNSCSGNLIGSQVYKIYIHFPDFNITNSKRHVRNIKDLYIKICLNSRLGSCMSGIWNSYFGGWRGTQTVSDYNSRYGHSHLYPFTVEYQSLEPFGYFCLGNTDLANISTLLIHNFEEDNFTLLLQQLRTYVTWESLEGGPYTRIGGITDVRRNPLNLGGTKLQNYYKKFLKNTYDKIPYTTEMQEFVQSVTINKDSSDFKKIMTELCDLEDLVYFDPITNSEFIIGQRSNNTPETINATWGNRVFFKFRGEDVKYKCVGDITDNTENLTQVANPSIGIYISNELNKVINKTIINEYISNNKSNS